MAKIHGVARLLLSMGVVTAMLSQSVIAEAAGRALGQSLTQIKLSANDNNALVFITGIASGSCGSSLGFLFDHTTARGKDLLQIATAALLSGKKVHATGNGVCTTVTWTPITTNPPQPWEGLRDLYILQ